MLRRLPLAERKVRVGSGQVEGPEVRITRAQLGRLLDERDRLFRVAFPDERERKRELALREARVQVDRLL
jgi:hypothetical protein